MSQGSLIGKDINAKEDAPGVKKLRIKTPKFDNSELIKGYQKTLIGRRMNPLARNVDNLLYMLPKIWNVEERVAGADIGNGCFQFDFTEEEDIVRILKTEPFHFDRWMISLVRWEPRLDSQYPSDITFWIRVMGLPLQFWAEPTFKEIGEAIGKLHDIDINMGRIKVTVDGFKPLHFTSELEFDDGVELEVNFQYERLHGFCRICHSLCHSDDACGENRGALELSKHINPEVDVKETKMLSYKGALGSNSDRGSGKEKVGAKRALSFNDTDRGERGGKHGHYEGRSKENYGRVWVKKGRQQASSSKNVADRDSEAKHLVYNGKKDAHKTMEQQHKQQVHMAAGSDSAIITEEMSRVGMNTLMDDGKMDGLAIEAEPVLVQTGLGEDDQRLEAKDSEDFINTLMSFDGLGEGDDLDDLLVDADMIIEEDSGDGDKVPEATEEGQLAKTEIGHGTKLTVRKKVIPPSTLGRGLNSKKRNALLLGSPRKHGLNKSVAKIGEGLYSKKAVGTSKANPET